MISYTRNVCVDIATVELQWLDHLWNIETMFETEVVRADEAILMNTHNIPCSI